MVTEIQIFFEGDKTLLKGFNAFLKPVIDSARQRRIRFQLVSGGSIAETIKDFLDAIQDNPDAFNILLVDSDGPDNGNLIASVRALSTWDNHIGATVQDGQIHFMVQVMESWFLADRDALGRYYGRDFQPNRLPPNQNVEQIPSNDVIRRLEDAARRTRKGKYHKTRHAPDLLAQIDAAKVRQAAPNCDRLFVTLNRLSAST